MKPYQIEDKTLTLNVKVAPPFVRITMFLFSFLCFTLPIAGMIAYVASGNGLHFGFFITIFIFSLFGFYLLRIALWNTYGKEVITLDDDSITYYAHYGWFKDTLKSIDATKPAFLVNPIGYIEDNQANLIIEGDESTIECAVKMSKSDMETMVKHLYDNQ